MGLHLCGCVCGFLCVFVCVCGFFLRGFVCLCVCVCPLPLLFAVARMCAVALSHNPSMHCTSQFTPHVAQRTSTAL